MIQSAISAEQAFQRIQNSDVLCAGWQLWQSLQRPDQQPGLSALDPYKPYENLDDSLCLAVLDGGRDFEFWRIGANILPRLLDDYTGRRFSDILSKRPGSGLWHVCRKAVDLKRPHFAVFHYIGGTPGFQGTQELHLPLQADEESGRVTDIIVFIDFLKETPDDIRAEFGLRQTSSLITALNTPAGVAPGRLAVQEGDEIR